MNLSNIPVNYEALHKDAVDTEREAYRKVKKIKIRKDILLYIYIARNSASLGSTGSELATTLAKILNTVRARLTELEGDGYIMKSDMRRKNANDNNEVVYTITPYGIVTVEKLLKENAYG